MSSSSESYSLPTAPVLVRLKLIAKEQVAENTLQCDFELIDSSFNFYPGQYLRLKIPSLKTDNFNGNVRDFSIVSSLHELPKISIAFRTSQSPFKKALQESEVGLEVEAWGPLGTFVLPDDLSVPFIFIAFGIGVTPFISMLRYLEHSKKPFEVQLCYANDTLEQAAYLNELREYAKRLPHFKLFEIAGHIEYEFITQNLSFANNPTWYICGKPEAVSKFTKEAPLFLNVLDSQLKTEEYSGYSLSYTDYQVPQTSKEKTQEISLESFFPKEPFVTSLLSAANSESLIAVTDKDGTIVSVNDRFVEVSKYPKEELIGQNHRILKSGFHPPSFYQTLWNTISSGRVWQGEIKNRDKNGEYYWVSTTISPVENLKGQITHYLSLRFLITERKDYQTTQKGLLNILDDFTEEKNKSKILSNRFELATDVAKIGVWEWNTATSKWNANQQFYDIHETSADQLNHKLQGWIDLFHPEDREEIAEKFNHILESSGEINETFKVKLPNGRTKIIHVAAKTEPSSEQTGVKLIGVVLDMTEQAQLDQMKSDFISLASHQLRTPLTAIKWYAEMLFKGDVGELTEDQKKIVKGLGESADRMVKLVTALLNLSRIESGRMSLKPKPTHLPQLMDSLLEMIRSLYEHRKQKIIKNYQQNLPQINVDSALIQEAYQNLVTNAIKYTPVEGTITLSIYKENDELITKIQDTGYGIPISDKDKIFQRFFRSDNIVKIETDGTGLGLYLTKLIVQLSGGRIWFESEEGKGSRFYIALPEKGSKAHKGVVTINT